MKIVIEKKKLDTMYSDICEVTESLSVLIDGYISNDELKDYMCGLLNGIRFHVEEAYNPELVELKLQLEQLRQKLQSGESTDMCAADDFQREYARIKQKIAEIENPF